MTMQPDLFPEKSGMIPVRPERGLPRPHAKERSGPSFQESLTRSQGTGDQQKQVSGRPRQIRNDQENRTEKTLQKPGKRQEGLSRSETLKRPMRAWGHNLKKGSDDFNQYPALAFLSGRLNPEHSHLLPEIVAESPFITEALSKNLQGFFEEERPLGDLAASLGIGKNLEKFSNDLGINPETPISPGRFFKLLGIDPSRVMSELSILKQNLPLGGLSHFMAKKSHVKSESPALNPVRQGSEKSGSSTWQNAQIPGLSEDLKSPLTGPMIVNPQNQQPEHQNQAGWILPDHSAPPATGLTKTAPESVSSLHQMNTGLGFNTEIHSKQPTSASIPPASGTQPAATKALTPAPQLSGNHSKLAITSRPGILNEFTESINNNSEQRPVSDSLQTIPFTKDPGNIQSPGIETIQTEPKELQHLPIVKALSEGDTSALSLAPNIERLSDVQSQPKTITQSTDQLPLQPSDQNAADSSQTGRVLTPENSFTQETIIQSGLTSPRPSQDLPHILQQSADMKQPAQTKELHESDSISLNSPKSLTAPELNPLNRNRRSASQLYSQVSGNTLKPTADAEYLAKFTTEDLDVKEKPSDRNSGIRPTEVGTGAASELFSEGNINTETTRLTETGTEFGINQESDQRAEVFDQIRSKVLLLNKNGGGFAKLDIPQSGQGYASLGVQVEGSDVKLKVLSSGDNLQQLLGQDLGSLKESLASQRLTLSESGLNSEGRGEHQDMNERKDHLNSGFRQQRDERQEWLANLSPELESHKDHSLARTMPTRSLPVNYPVIKPAHQRIELQI